MACLWPQKLDKGVAATDPQQGGEGPRMRMLPELEPSPVPRQLFVLKRETLRAHLGD